MSKTVFELIAGHLSADDDPRLWETATSILLAEAAQAAADTREEVYAEIGCCHHWISPHHPIRWKADGGFTWPFGYNKTVTAFRIEPCPNSHGPNSYLGRERTGSRAGAVGGASCFECEDCSAPTSGDPHDLDASLPDE